MGLVLVVTIFRGGALDRVCGVCGCELVAEMGLG